MPGLVPGIFVLGDRESEDVDGASRLVVIASAAKQSISRQNGCMDCFAALAMTWRVWSRAEFAARNHGSHIRTA
jgi:hypothetical protein